MKNRTSDYRRAQRLRVINRKKKIIKEHGGWYVRHEGQLSKNKIHCSCYMCRRKSYDEASAMDKRAAVSEIQSLEDCNDALYTRSVINNIHSRVKRSNKVYLGL